MNSTSKHQPALLPLFCPVANFRNEEDEFRAIQFGELPDLPNIEESESSSSSHIRPLDWCSNKEGNYDNFSCGICLKKLVNTPFYSCKECTSRSSTSDMRFHKECIEPISKHPCHSKHSLRYVYCGLKICLFCSCDVFRAYTCSICDFSVCPGCATYSSVHTIENPKRHEHALVYFLRKGSLVCDVCALSDHHDSIYSCHQCHFIVHKKCANFPCTIIISRHEHRLSFNSSLSPEKWLCGVCRIKIDTNYGRYSCVRGCSYGVHSKCATRRDIWDGTELKGTREEAYEDTKPFNEISDGIIQHFSHQNHHMKLDTENNRAFDEYKHCQACTLPICDDIIYSCMQCDFILHQTCAYLPRKKQHAFHPHILKQQVDNPGNHFECTSCHRRSNGFSYVCKSCNFKIDVRCASVPEPLDYQCHQHLFFFTSKPQSKQTCSVCQMSNSTCLNCGECGFVLCFQCATVPSKMRYKHDEHFLMLYFDRNASDQYWCDACEEGADPKKDGIYICTDCNITLHIKCLLGNEIYMMSGGRIEVIGNNELIGNNVDILPNYRLSHQRCDYCYNLCKHKVIYKMSDTGYIRGKRDYVGKIMCSYHCVCMYRFVLM